MEFIEEMETASPGLGLAYLQSYKGLTAGEMLALESKGDKGAAEILSLIRRHLEWASAQL